MTMTPSSASTAQRLGNLADKIAIQDLMYTYCRGVDRGDAALISQCYHPDAIDDHGSWQKRGDEVAAYITSVPLETGASLLHFVGNIYSEIKGDYAFVESYVLAYRNYLVAEQKHTRVRAVRFVDILERRDGLWKILERSVVDEFNRVDAVVQSQPGAERFAYSTRDQTDIAYRLQARFDMLSAKTGVVANGE